MKEAKIEQYYYCLMGVAWFNAAHNMKCNSTIIYNSKLARNHVVNGDTITIIVIHLQQIDKASFVLEIPCPLSPHHISPLPQLLISLSHSFFFWVHKHVHTMVAAVPLCLFFVFLIPHSMHRQHKFNFIFFFLFPPPFWFFVCLFKPTYWTY